MAAMTSNQAGSAASQTAASASQMGISPEQMGWMMLATTPQMMGVGGGQISGVRPGASAAQTASSPSGLGRARGRAPQAGGLAARYFNRTAKTTRIPQSYFNRQTRFFPESGR
jgi:hypothetical protein